MCRKIIVTILSAVLSFGFSVNTFAYDKNEVPATVNFFEKFGGAIVSIIAKAESELLGTDESKIQKAESSSQFGTKVDENYKIENPSMILECETWIMKEITLTSTVDYQSPFYDTDVDMILIGNGTKYVVPGFWAGENK